MLNFTYLIWDSLFFEKEIYKISIENDINKSELFDLINKLNGELFYVFSKSKNIFLLNNGADLVDEKITYQIKVANIMKYDLLKVKSFNSLPTKELIELTLLSGQYSRFKADVFLSQKFEQLYSLWLNRSLSREIADEVFVYVEDSLIEGFVTIRKQSNSASIGLIAVNPKSQQKGIGRKLIYTVNNWCYEKDIEILEVATQMANKKACDFYIQLGFELKCIDNIYHYYKVK
jgi:dTDP-4-amino-4,6-dideoxy-D-galactose acyltransferase